MTKRDLVAERTQGRSQEEFVTFPTMHLDAGKFADGSPRPVPWEVSVLADGRCQTTDLEEGGGETYESIEMMCLVRSLDFGEVLCEYGKAIERREAKK